MRLLDGLVNHVHEHGAALIIHGEAGIGKSALLAYTRTRAQTDGMLILACTGVQSEAHLPFAGLHQLLRPVLSEVADLPDPQRDARSMAFGLASSPSAPDLFLIALAALNLLTSAGCGPLLVLVDDAQWLDRPSSEILAFITRRIEADPTFLLFALRDGFASVLLEAGLPQFQLEGLDATAAATLLDAQHVSVDAAVRRRVPENAAGNPLVLTELPEGNADA